MTDTHSSPPCELQLLVLKEGRFGEVDISPHNPHLTPPQRTGGVETWEIGPLGMLLMGDRSQHQAAVHFSFQTRQANLTAESTT